MVYRKLICGLKFRSIETSSKLFKNVYFSFTKNLFITNPMCSTHKGFKIKLDPAVQVIRNSHPIAVTDWWLALLQICPLQALLHFPRTTSLVISSRTNSIITITALSFTFSRRVSQQISPQLSALFSFFIPQLMLDRITDTPQTHSWIAHIYSAVTEFPDFWSESASTDESIQLLTLLLLSWQENRGQLSKPNLTE